MGDPGRIERPASVMAGPLSSNISHQSTGGRAVDLVVCPKCGATFRPPTVPRRTAHREVIARKRLDRVLLRLRRTLDGLPPDDGLEGPVPGEQLRLFD